MAKNFSTVRELIYWEYAKLVVGRVVGNRQQYAFVNHIFRGFSDQKMSPSAILVENKKLFVEADRCAYCGSTENLQWEHIIPLAMGGQTVSTIWFGRAAHATLKKARVIHISGTRQEMT